MNDRNDTAKNIPYHDEGYITVNDETQLLLEHLAFIKEQLIRELIDYNCSEYTYPNNELPEDLTNTDPLWMNIEYDNQAYTENEEAVGNKLVDIDKNVSIGGVIQQYKNIGILDNRNISRKQVLSDIKASGKSIYNYNENYQNEGIGIVNPSDYGIDPNMNYGSFNVGRCIQHLISNAQPKSQHACAKYVRQALEAGGLSTAGRPNAAQDYHLQGFLPKIGFGMIAVLPTKADQAAWTNSSARPGDISVMQAPSHDWGHICMWSGKHWISDFVQGHMRPYGSAGRHPETCYIYRWQGA